MPAMINGRRDGCKAMEKGWIDDGMRQIPRGRIAQVRHLYMHNGCAAIDCPAGVVYDDLALICIPILCTKAQVTIAKCTSDRSWYEYLPYFSLVGLPVQLRVLIICVNHYKRDILERSVQLEAAGGR